MGKRLNQLEEKCDVQEIAINRMERLRDFRYCRPHTSEDIIDSLAVPSHSDSLLVDSDDISLISSHDVLQ
jgi:hypothetical protein